MSNPKIGRRFATGDALDQEHAADALAADRAEQPAPVEVERMETLSEPIDPVQEALAEQAAALAAVEAAQARVASAEQAVLAATAQAAESEHASGTAEAKRALREPTLRVIALRNALMSIHHIHGRTLRDMARTLVASFDPNTRNKLRVAYLAAGPLQIKLADALKSADRALHLAKNTQGGVPFSLDVALKACDSALEYDAGALRATIEKLIAEYHALRKREGIGGPAQVTIVLDRPASADVRWNK
ncbi:MAG: hypothetical protein WEG40_12790 [Candidatus Rokuibacteriota bacterium]